MLNYSELNTRNRDELNVIIDGLNSDLDSVYSSIRDRLNESMPDYMKQFGYTVRVVNIFGFEFTRQNDLKTIDIECGFHHPTGGKFIFRLPSVLCTENIEFNDDGLIGNPYLLSVTRLLSDTEWIRSTREYLKEMYAKAECVYEDICLVDKVKRDKEKEEENAFANKKADEFHDRLIKELKEADKESFVCITKNYCGYAPRISYRGNAVFLKPNKDGKYISESAYGFRLDSSKRVVKISTLKTILDKKWINH